MNNRLTVLAGPTAVGKGTISAYIRDHHPEVWFSVSATTRPRRPGEVDGVHYHFISDDEFDSLIAAGELLEYAVVHGRHRYGTPSAQVQEKLAQGIPALLEIDLQGARQVKDKMPEALFVFLAPPSWTSSCRDSPVAERNQRPNRSVDSPLPSRNWRPNPSSTSPSSMTTFALRPKNSYH